jgi:hypothetical protein
MTAELRRALVLAVPAWLASRVLALVSLLIAAAVHGWHLPRGGSLPGAHGWWAWDAAWYRSIAEHGYAGSPPTGERFFPLFPLLGRWTGVVLGGHDAAALIVLANLFAFAFAVAVVLLTRRELGAASAAPAMWLTMLAPGAVVLAMAYTEPLSGFLAAVFIIVVRRRGGGMWWAVPIGVLAGLTRPTGLLLAVIPAVELWRRRSTADVARLLAAAAAPVAGAAVFCGWTWRVYGDPLAPYHAQSKAGLRGGLVTNPVHALFFEPNRAGLPIPVRVLVVLAAIALVALTWRRLPPSIAAWATLAALAAMTSTRLTSLPRYLSADFPLLMSLAVALPGRKWPAAVVVSAALFVAVAVTGFGGGTVL